MKIEELEDLWNAQRPVGPVSVDGVGAVPWAPVPASSNATWRGSLGGEAGCLRMVISF